MNNLNIVFATKLDEYFLVENAHISSELFNRKLKYNEILVAKVKGKSVGFLIFEYLWSQIPFIAQIWINTDFRRQGIGRSILNYFEKYLNKNNHTMLLSSSMENNKNAQE